MILSTSNRGLGPARSALLTLALLLAAPACTDGDGNAPPAASAGAPPALRVVTTTDIMADWVKNIGGEHVEVFTLVPTGADPHGFQPGAQDVVKVAEADLVLGIGLGLEASWLRELLQNAARDPLTIVEVGDTIDPIEFVAWHADEVAILEAIVHAVHEAEEGEISAEAALEEIRELLAGAESSEETEEVEEHGEEDELADGVSAIVSMAEAGEMEAGDALAAIEELTSEDDDEHEVHGHGVNDPHFWFDPLRVKLAVNDISTRLSALDPERSASYGANAAAYSARLDELHTWTRKQVGAVPDERRLLVTSHDSLGYFANLYGFDVVGVILSTTTEVEPSAVGLADLVDAVTANGAPVVFGETTVSERLAQTVATESGARLVRLYSGSLGPEGSGAETYIRMVRTNVSRITEALR